MFSEISKLERNTSRQNNKLSEWLAELKEIGDNAESNILSADNHIARLNSLKADNKKSLKFVNNLLKLAE